MPEAHETGDRAPGDPRELLLELDLQRGRLRRDLRAALRTAIQEGRLHPGTRLPSSRRLAADLGVSRGVVADTYDQLLAEGYLTVTPRSAPLVATVARPSSTAPAEPVQPTWRFDFVATVPDVSLFPRRSWLRATERALRDAPDLALEYGDHRGRVELRRVLAEHLARTRGVRTDPGRIIVTQGFTQALDLLGRVLVARGARTMAVETPSLADERATIRGAGLGLEPVSVDRDGVRTGLLDGIGSHAILVTPAHQFPTGAVLSAERRVALVAWARARDRLIVEDDYDAEFRYDRAGIGAVQGLDPERVVHIGTVSKTLAPGVRLGWMSVPSGLVDALRATKAASDSGSPAVDQLALRELLTSGDYDRHVARARHAYRRRRDRLLAALGRQLPEYPVEGIAAGLHVVVRLPPRMDDLALVDAAAARGIGVRALSAMALDASAEPGLVLGYGRLAEERIDEAVGALAAAVRARTGQSS